MTEVTDDDSKRWAVAFLMMMISLRELIMTMRIKRVVELLLVIMMKMMMLDRGNR